MQTINPIFSATNRTLTNVEEKVNVSSYKGIAWKTIFLFTLVLLSAGLTAVFGFIYSNGIKDGLKPQLTINPWLLITVGIAGITGFLSILISSFAPKSASFFGPVYSLAQGVVLGFVTTIVGFFMPGVAILASSATLIIFLVCLLVNTFASMRAKSKIAKFFITMSIAMLLLMVVSIILRFAAPNLFVNLYEKNPNIYYAISIGISVFFIIYGALMLMGDFMYVDHLVQDGIDTKYEWSASLGIVFSIIWIYIELIKLFIILASLFKRD